MDRFTKKFAQIVPMIRSTDREVLAKQTPQGLLRTMQVENRQVDIWQHGVPQTGNTLVFEFHGGGMVLGYAAQNDALRQTLAEQTGACIIGVDYCKAPEHPYPAAIEEGTALIRQIVNRLSSENCLPGKLILMGCSGGATIATAIAMKMNGAESGRMIDGLLLYYPLLDAATDPAAKPAADTDALPIEVSRAFNQLYATPEQARDPYVSPLLADDEQLRLLPPCGLMLAGRDALCPEGEAFAKRLRLLKIPVEVRRFPEACHGFVEDYYNLAIYKSRGGEPEGLRYNGLQISAPKAVACGASFLRTFCG